MKLWKFSAREIRSRPGRAILTLLSIVIGVAAVVSVAVATTTTRRAYQQMYQSITGRAALEVVGGGGGAFAADTAEKLAGVPGLLAISPVVQRGTILYAHKTETDEGSKSSTRVKVQALGIDPDNAEAMREYELSDGKFFDAADEDNVVLQAAFARSLALKVGDDIKLLTQRGLKTFTVAGLVNLKNASQVSQGMLLLPLARAQNLFKASNRVDALRLVLKEDAVRDRVAATVTKRLPEGLDVREPAARSRMAEETLLPSEQGLQLATAMSLLVAVFIILNTFLMNVNERRRQLSIMRAIGATRKQIVRLLLAEGLMMGTLGTVLGIGVGLAGAFYLTQAMGRIFQVALPETRFTWPPLAMGAAFGMGISLIGTYLPARRAGKLSPLEGMGAISIEDIDPVRPGTTIAGAFIFLTCLVLLVGCIMGWLPISIAVSASVSSLVGIVLLLPPVLKPISCGVSNMLEPIWKVEGALAQRQIVRRRTRSTLTVGVLFIAIAFGVGMSNTVIDNVHDVKNWYQRSIVGDFFVRAMMPDMASGANADMPESFGEELAKITGITNLDTASLASTTAGGQQVSVVVRQFTAPEIQLDLKDADPKAVRPLLFEGQVIIGTVLAQRLGLKRGDDITVKTKQGDHKLHIAATTNEYSLGGLTLYMQRDEAKKLFDIEGVSAFLITADHSHLAAIEQQLLDFCREHGLLLQSFTDVSRLIDGMIAGVVGCLWVILALGFLVAAFGIVNTLTMNVLEQTRELGLLRIIAMTRSQVRRTVMAQAAIMGLMGLAPGTLAGVAIAYIFNISTLPATGHPVQFALHPGVLAGSFCVAYFIVMAAAWLPARRASRLDLSEALAYQ